MALLESEINSKVESLKSEATAAWKINDVDGFLATGEAAWDLFPNPKSNWNEGYNFAKFMFKGSMLKNELTGAELWLSRMVDNNNSLHNFDSDCEFNEGKLLFTQGRFEAALDKFNYVVKDAGFRYFENEDPKYLEFYRDPEKYKTH